MTRVIEGEWTGRLTLFVLLQALDIITTLIVLQSGGYEANPMVDKLMGIGPALGLVIAKLLAVTVAVMILRRGYGKAVLAANYCYAGIICWNLMALAVL